MRRKNLACYSPLLLKLFYWTLFSLIKMMHSTSFLNRTGTSDSTYSCCNNTLKIHWLRVKNRSYYLEIELLMNYLEKMLILCKSFPLNKF